MLALQEIERLHNEHAASLQEMERRGEAAAAAARNSAEATATRHLALIDRLMAEKDELGGRIAELETAAQVGR